MKKKHEVKLNITYFACFMLIVALYNLWGSNKKLEKDLDLALDTIEEQNRAIYAQQLYNSIWSQVNNSPINNRQQPD